MKLEEQDVEFRAVYIFSTDVSSTIYTISDKFKSKRITSVDTKVPNDMIKSIVLNCSLNTDVSDAYIDTLELKKKVGTKQYTPTEKIYVSAKGEEIPLHFVFIEDKIQGKQRDQMEYSICAFSRKLGKVNLFTVPCRDMKLESIHVINFEIERFLKEFEVVYLDEVDLKYLFEEAILYVESEQKKAVR